MRRRLKNEIKLKNYENLRDTLLFYGVDCHQPYYVSSGNTIFEFPDKSFRMDFYSICICINGEITIEINSKLYTIAKNSFFISAPSTIVRFKAVSIDLQIKLLFFENNFLLKNMANPFFIEKLSLFQHSYYSLINSNEVEAEKLHNILNYLKEQSKRNGKFVEDIIRTIIINLLLEAAHIIDQYKIQSSENHPLNNSLFYKFMTLVNENSSKHKEVDFYANQLFISNKHLIVLSKKATGKTPHQIIDEALLKEAFVLLSIPELTVSEIAYRLQFNSNSAFGRFFKRYTTISPSEYRIREDV